MTIAIASGSSLTPQILEDLVISKVRPNSKTEHPDVIHPSAYDIFVIDVYVPSVTFYRLDPSDPSGLSRFVSAVKDSLSAVLSIFYPFAGKWIIAEDGWIRKLICNDEGAVFVEATIDDDMDKFVDYHHFTPIELLTGEFAIPGFQPSVLHKSSGAGAKITEFPSLLVQVIGFKCGGVALTTNFNHMTVDGMGFDRFLKAWSEIAATGHTSIAPICDRSALPSHLDKDITAMFGVSLDSKNVDDALARRFRLDGTSVTVDPTRFFSVKEEVIEKLKGEAKQAYASDMSGRRPYATRFECIQAKLAQCLRRISHPTEGFDGEIGDKLDVWATVEGRKRWSTPILSEEYIGNVTIIAPLGALDSSFGSSAVKVHEVIKSVNHQSGPQFLANQFLMAKMAGQMPSQREGSVPTDMSGGQISLCTTSWLGFDNYYALDFGSGKPFLSSPNLCFRNHGMGGILVFHGPPDSDIAASIQCLLPAKILEGLLKDQEFQDFVA